MATSGCSESWRRRVADYHDGDISSAERSAVTAHLATCADCQTLLASYDHLYRRMRTMAGFDGSLTIAPQAGIRSGRSGAARPLLTWPNRNSSVQGSGKRRISLATVLLVVLGVAALLFSHASTSITPSSAPKPNNNANGVATTIPTFGPFTPRGQACVNVGATDAMPYVFRDATALWYGQGCGEPSILTHLKNPIARIGSWSPAGDRLLLFMSAATGASLTVFDRKSSQQQPITATATLGSAIDDADWLDAQTLVARTHTSLLLLDLVTKTATPITAGAVGAFEVRGGQIFYTTLNQTLYRYDRVNHTSMAVFALSTADGGNGVAWDVAPNGAYVVYGQTSGTSTKFLYKDIRGGDGVVAFTAAMPGSVTRIRFSPDSAHLAAIVAQPMIGATLVIGNFTNAPPLSLPSSGSFVWRPDSQYLIDTALVPTVIAPRLVAVATGIDTPLRVQSADYLWQAVGA